VEVQEPLGILPGEFEPQDAILLAWPQPPASPSPEDAKRTHGGEDRVFCDIVRAIGGSVQVVILVEHAQSQQRVTRLLSQAGIDPDTVRIVQVPLHSEWIRDFGPLAVRAADGSYTWIDADYVNWQFIHIDPHEDRLPSVLGALFGMPVVRAPVAVQQGNFLSNGRGLCIATRRLLYDNASRGYDAEDIARLLERFYGAEKVVFLEELKDEPTGHVDMFATFAAPDTVVVGRCAPGSDPENAAILDRNAERLASLRPPFGPLKVARIPMPPKVPSTEGWKLWPSYTNVVYANNVLLLPVFPGLDPIGESSAFNLYRQLLPGWTIVPIDSDPLLELWGGIHCITVNLSGVGKNGPAIPGGHSQRPSSGD
jgi:agmatine/peptidylarginine deiminase